MQKIGSTSNSEPYQLSNSAYMKIESNSSYRCSVQVLHLEWRNSTGRLVKIRHLRIANHPRNINWGDYRSARGSFNGDNRNGDPAELQTLRKRGVRGEDAAANRFKLRLFKWAWRPIWWCQLWAHWTGKWDSLCGPYYGLRKIYRAEKYPKRISSFSYLSRIRSRIFSCKIHI